jgi:hypothetical protein
MYFMRSVGLGRAAPALTAATVAMVLLSGCQADPDPAATQTAGQPSSSSSPASTDASASASASASAPASSEPSPASSAGPAANLPVPVKPALADEYSAEGLEAFTKYWFELFSYGYETNDWVPFEAVTGQNCRTCNQVKEVVQGIYKEGQWISGGEFEVISFSTDFRTNTEGSVQVFVDNEQAEITYFGKNGSAFPPEPTTKAMVDVIFASYAQGGWTALDFGRPEGT